MPDPSNFSELLSGERVDQVASAPSTFVVNNEVLAGVTPKVGCDMRAALPDKAF